MKKKVVVLGGGTGMSYLLRGLKDFPIDITAIVSVADNGKSTGKLRKEFAIPAVGDIRKVLFNMSTLPIQVKEVMEYRFDTHSDLNGHPIGNLMLTAMLKKNKSLKESIDCLMKLLQVKHKVLPLSEDYLTLVGETIDNETIVGQVEMMKAYKKYRKIYYQEKPHVLKEVIEEIKNADLIILSMGSIYTSITPHLICQEVSEAIKKSPAKVMYLCNIMSQPGETTDSLVSNYLEHIESYLGTNRINVVIANNTPISKRMLKKYEDEEKEPVIIDKEKISKMNIELIEADLVNLEDGTIKHDSLKLSSLILSYLVR
ncbi:MAG: YvcK family protein [bacterium]|nr:YvcK family protein [bacterium]